MISFGTRFPQKHRLTMTTVAGQYRRRSIGNRLLFFNAILSSGFASRSIGLSRRPRAERCGLQPNHRHGRRWAIAAAVGPLNDSSATGLQGHTGHKDVLRPWMPTIKAEGRQQKAESCVNRRKAQPFSFCILLSALLSNSACLHPPKAVHTPALRPQKACRTGCWPLSWRVWLVWTRRKKPEFAAARGFALALKWSFAAVRRSARGEVPLFSR